MESRCPGAVPGPAQRLSRPGDFWRALHARSYSTEDLLLYLTGMLDLPSREARVKRLGELDLPAALREDMLELVDAMDANQAARQAGAAPQSAGQKAPAPPTAKASTPPAQRKRL